MEKEKIEPGKYVELGYDLYKVTPEGEELVHQTSADDPERIIYGVTRGVIVPLEKAIEGMQAGDEFDVLVKSEDAFGPHDSEQMVTLPRDIFVVDDKFDEDVVKPGAVLPMMTADGYKINGVVAEVGPENVVMDFNHPLAGKDVRFKGKITLVRDATAEELKPQAGCGCGCEGSCGCEGGCDDGACDTGCGCEGGCK